MLEFVYAKKIKKDTIMEVIDKYKDDYYLNISYRPNGTTEIFIGSKKKEVRASLVLGKVKAEIESCREDEKPHLCDYRYHRNEGLDMALDIIDKYKAESEDEG